MLAFVAACSSAPDGDVGPVEKKGPPPEPGNKTYQTHTPAANDQYDGSGLMGPTTVPTRPSHYYDSGDHEGDKKFGTDDEGQEEPHFD
jgi:hypothetical protein